MTDTLAKEEWEEVNLDDLFLNTPYTTESIAIGDTTLTPNLEAHLQQIVDIKNFAAEKLGLAKSLNYMRLRSTKDARTIYRLYVTPKMAMPGEWDHWVHVGEDTHEELYDHPVVLASSKVDLMEEKEFYTELGYDVLHRKIRDFCDARGCDLTPEFLTRNVASQAGTLFHEDWHHTLRTWHPDTYLPPEIDEVAASLVGRIGAIEYTLHTYGKRSQAHKEAVWEFKKKKKEAKAINQAHEELSIVLNSGMEPDQKAAKRETILTSYERKGWLFDNAALWDKYPYSKHYPLMVDVGKKIKSVRGFVEVMRGCPMVEPEAVAYLSKFLKD